MIYLLQMDSKTANDWFVLTENFGVGASFLLLVACIVLALVVRHLYIKIETERQETKIQDKEVLEALILANQAMSSIGKSKEKFAKEISDYVSKAKTDDDSLRDFIKDELRELRSLIEKFKPN